ncbi:hypothetical protein VTO73DRAFT_15564 [Trametes versicolor]
MQTLNVPIARNILLLSMILDNIPAKIVWNIFLDLYFDDDTLAAFTAQCRKLVEQSETVSAWQASSYASTLRMGTDFTLEEVHRHWSLYLVASEAMDNRALALRQLMADGSKRVLAEHYGSAEASAAVSAEPSSGPFSYRASAKYTEHLREYWQTGSTSSSTAEPPTATHVNPTFLYSGAGEGFAVHHSTDPLAPFHLAHVFGNARNTPTTKILVSAAQEEFRNWCEAFRIRALGEERRLVVRFLLGDPLAVAQALQARNDAAFSQRDAVPVAPWTGQVFRLNAHEYDRSDAPTRFDAIDTSNLCYDVGLVNVLLSSIPLLSESSPASGLLYTEHSLDPDKHSDAAQQFASMLVSDLATTTLLFNLAPVDALSGFTTQSDTHELHILSWQEQTRGVRQTSKRRHRQRLTWRRPWTADRLAASSAHSPALIDIPPPALSLLLFDIYSCWFGAENMSAARLDRGAQTRASYTRETFIVLLRFLRTRLRLSRTKWLETARLFLDHLRSSNLAQTGPGDFSHLELMMLLNRHRLFTVPAVEEYHRPPIGRLSRWTTIPPLVRVYLSIPDGGLEVLGRFSDILPNPPLHCVVRSSAGVKHVFESVHAVSGHIVDVGTPSEPAVVVKGDRSSASGPLVLSFIIPTRTLTDVAPPDTTFIQLAVAASPRARAVFGLTLGKDLTIASACLDDVERVHVVPVHSLEPPQTVEPPAEIFARPPEALGTQQTVIVEFKHDEPGVARIMTTLLLVEDPMARALFAKRDGGVVPHFSQTSPCTVRVALGAQGQHLVFPVPICGSKWIAGHGKLGEVLVYMPFAVPSLGKEDGLKVDPFPVVRGGDALVAWNMHRINLDQLPVVDKHAASQGWLNTHVSSQFSERESLMKGGAITPMETLTLLKNTIQYILTKAAGYPKGPPKKVFALRDNATNDIDTILFVQGVRYDWAAYTVVCDAFVLPLCAEHMPTIQLWLTRLRNSGITVTNARTHEGETRAWKQLLPALVERCRTSWSHARNCEYIAEGRIPLSVEVRGGDPLCSCGRGKDVEGMHAVELWRDFAPLVTRIALSPLFAVSYLEQFLHAHQQPVMASPLYWPGKYYFYPIGNTAAVSLTRDLPPDVPAKILLLPCGDTRNVLYTIFCESPSITRKLDFTCGDYDPGVLARNVLLLAMIMDDVAPTAIWDVFFHMYLGDSAHDALLSQCRKLLACSATSEDWHASPYGTFLRVGTEHTLLEIRRLWSFYADSTVPVGSPRALAARKMVDTGRKEVIEHNGEFTFLFSSARSSGPLLLPAVLVYTDHFKHYWKTGSTDSSNDSPSAKARHANPTFLRSRRGDGFRVHYGTDPLAGFHLAPLFGNRTSAPSVQQAVADAQAEFRDWCQAFRARTKASRSCLTVRFILGDAIHIAGALSTWNSRETAPPIPIAPWTSTVIDLYAKEYYDRHAPTLFDVVDTSNLSDHVGLLNILLATIPLLSNSEPWCGVLYTEFLLAHRSDPTTQITSLLLTDISVATTLLGMCPVDALSGFTTTCQSNEVLLDTVNPGRSDQHHQIVTWRRPHTSDPHAQVLSGTDPPPSMQFNSEQLASLLCNAYYRLFGDEDATHLLKIQKTEDIVAAVHQSRFVRYSRESFALFLHLARTLCPLSGDQWTETMRLLFDKIRTSGSLGGPHPLDNTYHQDLAIHMYRHHVYTIPVFLAPPRAAPGRLSQWTSIPPLVRIYLVVPPEKFAVLRDRAETPPLHCVVSANGSRPFECGFQSVHATFGTLTQTGSAASPAVVVQEAKGAFDSDASPLVVSFVVHTWMLTDAVPDPANIFVEFCVKSTPFTARTYMSELGLRLAIFSAPLSDTEHVHIVPEARPPALTPVSSSGAPVREAGAKSRIGAQAFVHVDLDVKTDSVASLTARLEVQDADSKTTFANGALPIVTQPSPFTIRVALGSCAQDLIYPLPVIGDRQKLRLARKSLYIEVVVPVAMPFPKAWALQSSPFPVIQTGSTLFPWNLHRLPLDRLPALDVTELKSPTGDWFNPHVSLQMSHREKKMRERESLSGLALVKDTIHTIMVRFAGIQGGPRSRVFALHDEATSTSDTMFFVSELRYDLACHTIVCDAFVLLISQQLVSAANPWLQAVGKKGIESVRVYGDEMRTWKQLLPGLVERCRATWKHGKNCEYAARGKIPLELEMAGDPLCSCGRGKDVDGMCKDDAWKKLAPFVTRVALSPLFAVPYLEPIFERDDANAAGEFVGFRCDPMREVLLARHQNAEVLTL